jgi:hypothetical protein
VVAVEVTTAAAVGATAAAVEITAAAAVETTAAVEVGVGGDLSRRARRERLSFVMLRTSILTLHEKQ